MRYDGLQRSWMLAVPIHPVSPRLPLLVVLHGRNTTPMLEAQRSDMLALVASGRAIEVYPAGVEHSWNAGRCCGAAHVAHVDDVGFLTAMVRHLGASSNIDAQRVALVGFSNGGKLALHVTCGHALDVPGVTLRGVAVVAAASVSSCASGPSAPLVQLAGTHDPLVPYSKPAPAPVFDGKPLTPVVTEFAGWRTHAGCAGSPTTTRSAGLQVATWSCRGGPMQLVTDPGGGHSWPPGAAHVIWQFLQPLLTSTDHTHDARI
jgi:polyhydroxybutyrate depolymerase